MSDSLCVSLIIVLDRLQVSSEERVTLKTCEQVLEVRTDLLLLVIKSGVGIYPREGLLCLALSSEATNLGVLPNCSFFSGSSDPGGPSKEDLSCSNFTPI